MEEHVLELLRSYPVYFDDNRGIIDASARLRGRGLALLLTSVALYMVATVYRLKGLIG